MDIVIADTSDDALLARIHAVMEASDAASRVVPVRRDLAEIVENLRFAFPGERQELAVAVEDGQVLGYARVFLPQRENLDKAWAEITVDPAYRGRGAGTALVAWSEDLAVRHGRTIIVTEAYVPAGDRTEHPVARFAIARGYALASTEVVRRLRLPTPAGLLDGLAAASEPYHRDYDLSVHVDGVPEHLRQGVCDAENRLIVDAPTGDVDYEAESMTPEDYAEFLALHARSGITMLTAIAVHRQTGVVAAYTDLALLPGDTRAAHQWGTLVVPEHRGHRLGMAVKVANLLHLEHNHPERELVLTQNAEDNPWMVQINVDLGFEIVEDGLSLKKDLPTAAGDTESLPEAAKAVGARP